MRAYSKKLQDEEIGSVQDCERCGCAFGSYYNPREHKEEPDHHVCLRCIWKSNVGIELE